MADEDKIVEKTLMEHLDLLERSAKASTSDSFEVQAAVRSIRMLINLHEATDRFTEVLRETTRAADAMRGALRQVKQSGVLDRKHKPAGDLC
jgi:hypothetical protein